MKILFTARATLFTQPGGDTQQMVQSAQALRAVGMEVDIRLRGEKIDSKNYDIIHFFNLGRPAGLSQHLLKRGKPLVISSIWVDYTEWEAMQGGARGLVYRLLKASGLEYLKTLARAANKTDAWPDLYFVLRGQSASMKRLADRADVIITTSNSEINRLNKAFDVGKKCIVVPLGVAYSEKVLPAEKDREGVICVGRIEGLKNQLNLIRAANRSAWQLTLIGKPAANQPAYYTKCKHAAGPNVHFAGWLEAEEVERAYQNAKVLVLPSYFETFGLVALEALANGCNLVLAHRPDMNEVFKGKAIFCDPTNPADIRQKVEQALALSPPALPEEWWQQFTWRNHASELRAIYTSLLKPKTNA